MGWLSWERYRCQTDCTTHPSSCINADLYLQQAKRLVLDGYMDAGYTFVNVDDCYLSHQRTSDGKLVANSTRFPGGMRALSDQIHAMGLHVGVYEDVGTTTCGGYPGLEGHDVLDDMRTIAEDWQVDMLKVDGCNFNVSQMDVAYPALSRALLQARPVGGTRAPVVLSCSWPDYVRLSGAPINLTAVAQWCNMWRMYDDIQDSWESVVSIVEYYATQQDVLVPVAGPGAWNDPDMLIIGDFGLSHDQQKAQFALWAIMAAPLLMSNDLRSMPAESKAILLNKEIIAVDQDELGMQGRRVKVEDKVLETWARPLKGGQIAVVLFNRGDTVPTNMTVDFESVGAGSWTSAKARDLYAHEELGTFGAGKLSLSVNPSGVRMVVLTRA